MSRGGAIVAALGVAAIVFIGCARPDESHGRTCAGNPGRDLSGRAVAGSEDAVRNAKAAVEEGIVAGGGVALLQAGAGLFEGLGLEGDEATGANIVKVALEAPLKQIAVNAGLEGGVVAEKVRGLTAGEGLDAATGTFYSRTKQSSRAGRSPAT